MGPSHHAPDGPAVHGMLIVGAQHVFLSHLPMFHPPHEFQVLLKVKLSEAGRDVAPVYFADRQKTATRIYTWVPQPFILSELAPDQEPQRRRMRGTIFRGHFERGGQPITSGDVVAEVDQIYHFRKFESSRSALPELQYLLFGEPGDLFVAHLITAPPDFDHVLSVKPAGIPPSTGQSAALLRVLQKKNLLEQRLSEGESIQAMVSASDLTLPLIVVEEFYLETGDLAS